MRSLVLGFEAELDGHTVNLYELIRDVNPDAAMFWAIIWMVMAMLVFVNMFIAILTESFTFITEERKRQDQLQSRYPMPSWRDHIKLKLLFFIKDPDKREPLLIMAGELDAWNLYLDCVDRDKLYTTLRKCVARGNDAFEVGDAMELFPCSDDVESYRQAFFWMKGLADAIGIKEEIKSSIASETRTLLYRLGKLEEEAMGLTIQLHRVAPQVPCLNPI